MVEWYKIPLSPLQTLQIKDLLKLHTDLHTITPRINTSGAFCCPKPACLLVYMKKPRPYKPGRIVPPMLFWGFRNNRFLSSSCFSAIISTMSIPQSYAAWHMHSTNPLWYRMITLNTWVFCIFSLFFRFLLLLIKRTHGLDEG